MNKVRTYKVEACPEHGTRKMRNGHCMVVTERTADRITHCYEGELLTAIDARDVEGLVAAVRTACGRIDASSKEVEWGDDFEADVAESVQELLNALAPFDASTQEGE